MHWSGVAVVQGLVQGSERAQGSSNIDPMVVLIHSLAVVKKTQSSKVNAKSVILDKSHKTHYPLQEALTLTRVITLDKSHYPRQESLP